MFKIKSSKLQVKKGMELLFCIKKVLNHESIEPNHEFSVLWAVAPLTSAIFDIFIIFCAIVNTIQVYEICRLFYSDLFTFFRTS